MQQFQGYHLRFAEIFWFRHFCVHVNQLIKTGKLRIIVGFKAGLNMVNNLYLKSIDKMLFALVISTWMLLLGCNRQPPRPLFHNQIGESKFSFGDEWVFSLSAFDGRSRWVFADHELNVLLFVECEPNDGALLDPHSATTESAIFKVGKPGSYKDIEIPKKSDVALFLDASGNLDSVEIDAGYAKRTHLMLLDDESQVIPVFDGLNFSNKLNAQMENSEQDPARNRSLVKIYLVTEDKLFDELLAAEFALVVESVPWSMDSTIARQLLFDCSFQQARKHKCQLSCFVIDESFHRKFEAKLKDLKVPETQYNSGHRERGTILLFSKGEFVDVHVRDTKDERGIAFVAKDIRSKIDKLVTKSK